MHVRPIPVRMGLSVSHIATDLTVYAGRGFKAECVTSVCIYHHTLTKIRPLKICHGDLI